MKITGGMFVRMWLIVVMCLWQMAIAGSARGNPTNGVVASGEATIGPPDGTTLTIRQATPKVIINWDSFNIAPNEVTHFIQPSALSIALNRISGGTPSEIFGALRANGIVMLLNRNGVIFQPGSQVDVGGLVASSLHMTDRDFLAGNYRLVGAITDGLVRNVGNIRAGSGGVYLIAPNVENGAGGIITANDGTVSLAAGTTAYLSSRSDGRGFLVELQAPAGAALNLGTITADGGHISMSGLSVNQQGVVQANALQSRGGKIELVAKQSPTTPGPTSARASLSASSRTQADGGSIEVVGQEVVHDGLLQANAVGNQRGRVDVRATEGGQPGAGVVTTGATSRIQADGGDVLVQGNSVTHQGAAQADSVGTQAGHVLFWGKQGLTFVGASSIRARGSQTGISNGGTIIGMATDLSSGLLDVRAGATFDVSGGVQGGHGGELLLGDRRGETAGFGAVPFVGTAATGYLAGRFRLIPADLALDIGSQDLGPLQDVTLVALNNVSVTGVRFLESVAPGAPAGRLRFLAGNDLAFDNTTIRVDPFTLDNPGSPKDLVGHAGNDIRLTNSILSTGHGGSIWMTARSGSIRLIDPATFTLSSLRVKGGGDLVLTAQQDIVASMRVAQELTQSVLNGEDDSNVQGLLVDGTRFTNAAGVRTGTGTLSITTKEGNFIGGNLLGNLRGPGFMARNADAVVSVRGRIGDPNLPLDASGLLPDGLALATLNRDRAAQGLLPLEEDASGYLDLAMTDAKVSIHAGGNLYVRRVSDAGVAWDLANPLAGTADWGRFRTPGTPLEGFPNGQPFLFGALLNEGFQHNDAILVSRHGNLVLDTQRTPFFESGGHPDMQVFSQHLPARFDAQATEGSVQIRSGLGFFNGPQARLNISAGGNIEGLLTYALGPPPAEFIRWVYIPNHVEVGLSLRNYVAYDTRKPIDPSIRPFLLAERPSGLPAPETSLQVPDNLFELQPGFVPFMRITGQPPSSLVGRPIGVVEESGGVTASTLDRFGIPDQASPAGTIRMTAGDNIHNLSMDFRDPTYLKDTRIQAGSDIRNVDLQATPANLGTETRTVVESIPMLIDPTTGRILRAPGPDDVILIRDPNDGGRIRPWNGTEAVDPANVVNIRMVSVTKDIPVAKPAVTIEAGQDIKLGLVPESTPTAPGPSFGLRFFGNGAVSIKAGRDLDLGNGTGITMTPGLTPTRNSSLAGVLDIGVGRNLTMAQSRIVTDGGAGVSIHGNDPAYIPGYDNSALHPSSVPLSVRGRRNLAPIGGFIDVGDTVGRRIGEESTGIQVRVGGSVGVRANRATVGFTDPPIVNFPLVRDPAAVHIQATGDVNVRTSRIATFSGGDIRIISTAGSINAGSGGKGEQQLFQLEIPLLDANGRPIVKEDGTLETIKENFEVPGSGIFTYHPTDPQVLNFPKFDTPEITALKNEIFKQRVFNRNTASLEARAEALIDQRTPEFDALFEDFITRNPAKVDPITGKRLPLSLGDVALDAGLDIVVPPAGIRGRRVDLIAGRTLDFQGGEVQGKVTFKAANLSGDVQVTGTFSGGASVSIASSGGGGSVGGLSGVTGTVGASAGASVASVSTAQKTSEAAQEAVKEASNQQNQQAAATGGKEKDEKGKLARALRVKRGVVIQVDVKPQAQSLN